MMTASFTEREVLELQELCEWLSTQQMHSAYSDVILRELPHLKHWVSKAYKDKRRDASLIYFRTGYGWCLHKRWRPRLKWLQS